MRESRKLRYAIRANVLMSYELAMGFYRRSFYERCYQPSDAYTCTRVYIYIYIFTRCNGCRCIPRTHRRNGHHSNDEAISRCSISVLSHGKNLYSLFTSIPRFHPFSTGNCIAVLRTFEWRPLDYVKTRQDIPLVKQQNYPIIA